MNGFSVRVIDARNNKARRYFIHADEAIPPGMPSIGPSRTLAGIRARERLAVDLGEEYSSEIHKVLSITERA